MVPVDCNGQHNREWTGAPQVEVQASRAWKLAEAVLRRVRNRYLADGSVVSLEERK